MKSEETAESEAFGSEVKSEEFPQPSALLKRETTKGCGTRTSIGEVKGVDAVGDSDIGGVFGPDVGEFHRDRSQSGTVPGGLHFEGAGAVATDLDGDGLYALAVKVFEAAGRAVHHVHDIGLFLVPVASVLGRERPRRGVALPNQTIKQSNNQTIKQSLTAH